MDTDHKEHIMEPSLPWIIVSFLTFAFGYGAVAGLGKEDK